MRELCRPLCTEGPAPSRRTGVTCVTAKRPGSVAKLACCPRRSSPATSVTLGHLDFDGGDDKRRGPEGLSAVTPLTGNRAALLLPVETVRRRRNLAWPGGRSERRAPVASDLVPVAVWLAAAVRRDDSRSSSDPDDDADDDRDALHETPPSVHDLHDLTVGGDRSRVVRRRRCRCHRGDTRFGVHPSESSTGP